MVVLLAVALLAVSSGAALAERVALVIGNGAYRAADTLINPPKDATAIAAKLETLGFEVTRALDADAAAMRAALETFGEEAQRAEVAVIFYAGHGLQIDGENYLIPVDARISGRGDLEGTTLRASDIYAALLAAEPEAAVLILDACRDNPFVPAVATSAGLASGSVSAAAFVQRPNSAGMVIGFAAAPGAVAFDGGDGNSPYTTALLQWIDRPGLEIGAMFRRVRGTVVDLTSGAQIPWVEEALLREIYLQPAAAVEAGPANPPDDVEIALLRTIRALDHPVEQTAALQFYDRLLGDERLTPAALPDAEAAPDESFVRQGLIWLSIRSGTDADLFKRYLEIYPESVFAALARERLSQLAAAALPTPVVMPDVVAPPLPPAAGGSSGRVTPSEEAVLPQDPAVATELPRLDGAGEADATPVIDESALELALGPKDLAAVQSLLTAAGFDAGSPDGRLGPTTQGAIAEFQSATPLPATGRLDSTTLRALVGRSAGTLLRTDIPTARRDAIHRVAAIANEGLGAGPTVLRVAALSRNEAVHAYWQEVARTFEAEHPGAQVVITHQSDESYRANLLGMLGSETPPDIVHTWGGGHLDALRDAGFARDLTNQMTAGWALKFRPGALQTYTSDGRIYGAPATIALVSLWVNQRILSDVGIPLDQLRTWDGFMAAVRALKAKGIVPLAIGGREEWPFQLIWGSLAEAIGGRSAFEAAYRGESPGFLADAFVEAGDLLRGLGDLHPFQDGYLAMSEDEAGNAFARGGAAMVVTGNWRLHSMRWNWPGGPDRMRRDLRRLDFPSVNGAGGELWTYGGVDGYAVNSQAPDLAVDLLRLLTSPEVQSRIAELSSAIPSASGSDLTLEDPLVAEVASTLLSSSYHQLYYDQALGPIAGEVVNDVTARLATGQIGGREAAAAIETAWSGARSSREAPAPLRLQPLLHP